jgi:hypothetical protein
VAADRTVAAAEALAADTVKSSSIEREKAGDG